VADGQQCYLLDPLAFTNMQPFVEVLHDTNVLKVFHACLEDIDLFKKILNAVPAPIFDTQMAAALAGLDFSMGYQRLVQTLCGVTLEKTETRSDWLQRPLTSAQLHYAVLDVMYLPTIYEKLVTMLKDKGRLTWMEEDSEALLNEAQCWDDFEHYYINVGAAWKLNRKSLAVLKALCIWREIEARSRNVPRGHVLKEKQLWPIAYLLPTTLTQLAHIDGMSPYTVQKEGKIILNIITKALKTPEEQCPPLLLKPFSETMGKLMRKLKQHIVNKAQELGVPVEMIVRRRQLNALISSGLESGEFRLPPGLQGWRADVIGNELLLLLSAEFASKKLKIGAQ
jgi:ribonuclease D